MMNRPLHFSRTVPDRHRASLTKAYEAYCSEHMIRFFNENLQIILNEWVSQGNDPYRTNRYGFYDSRKQEYLDFLSGEGKAQQICRIMTGQYETALCGYNQYGEPLPTKGLVRIPQHGLLDETALLIMSGIEQIQNKIR